MKLLSYSVYHNSRVYLTLCWLVFNNYFFPSSFISALTNVAAILHLNVALTNLVSTNDRMKSVEQPLSYRHFHHFELRSLYCEINNLQTYSEIHFKSNTQI